MICCLVGGDWMRAEFLLKDRIPGRLKLKRKGYDDMHTLTDTMEIKELDPKDRDEVEM